MTSTFRALTLLAIAAAVAGCGFQAASTQNGANFAPAAASAEGTGETFRVKFETTQGDFVVEVHPEWAPNGAKQLRTLVEEKFYDDVAFFRVIDGFMAQFGMSGDPKVQEKWGEKTIQDDPVKQSNVRGYVTFAQTGAPNSRSTQLFINYGDNSRLDEQRFAPVGKVVEGMDVVDKLHSGYGEGAPGGRGPSQGEITRRGNAYLKERFPNLDYIKTARIVEEEKKE
ncbi:MAG: peptidylprolyl isomerase [Planctomycetales bacterium]